MIRLKSKADIEGIRYSCRLLAELFNYVDEIIVEGMTGKDLDKLMAEWIQKKGVKSSFLGYGGFPAHACISLNEAVIHGIPSKIPFKSGDIVGVDCGLVVNNYYSDMAKTYPIGKVSKEIEGLLETTLQSLYLGIAQAINGNRIHDISKAIYTPNKARGFGVVRPYCGHGVGLDVHEDPQVPNYVSGPNPRLKPGMVLAIEPMINLGGDDVKVIADNWTVVTKDGKPSAHFEHTIVILENETQILTEL